jgi:hypothetical protein
MTRHGPGAKLSLMSNVFVHARDEARRDSLSRRDPFRAATLGDC